MSAPILYTNPMSRGRTARWMLEEVGTDYETVIVDFESKSALDEINPMGKVPTLVHRGTVVTETAAICAYLADAFAYAGLAPPLDSALRGDYYRWLFFAAGPLEAAATNRALGVEVTPEREAMVGYGTLGRTLDTLDAALTESGHLVGSAFTAADLYVGAHLAWGMGFGTIERRPVFEAVVERNAARPAAIRAAELDDALLPAQAG